MIKDATLTKFEKRVSDLPDEPALTPAELKARFDACPEELRGRHNALVGDLLAPGAAAELGFARTAGVPADSVQAAVVNVQKQLRDIALGTVPEGSIGRSMLAKEVTDELGEIHSQIGAHAQVDAGLQSQIHTKAEIVVGTYTGNNEVSRLISLGFTPRAVLVTDKRSSILESGYSYGGFAVTGRPAPGVKIEEGGFAVYFDNNTKNLTNSANSSSNPYAYIAIK